MSFIQELFEAMPKDRVVGSKEMSDVFPTKSRSQISRAFFDLVDEGVVERLAPGRFKRIKAERNVIKYMRKMYYKKQADVKSVRDKTQEPGPVRSIKPVYAGEADVLGKVTNQLLDIAGKLETYKQTESMEALSRENQELKQQLHMIKSMIK